jgi:hypothetical protein
MRTPFSEMDVLIAALREVVGQSGTTLHCRQPRGILERSAPGRGAFISLMYDSNRSTSST